MRHLFPKTKISGTETYKRKLQNSLWDYGNTVKKNSDWYLQVYTSIKCIDFGFSGQESVNGKSRNVKWLNGILKKTIKIIGSDYTCSPSYLEIEEGEILEYSSSILHLDKTGRPCLKNK